MNYGEGPFGLNAIKVVGISGSPIVTLEATQQMKFTPRMLGGELTGNDQIVAVAASVIALDWTLQEGGIPLAAYALMTGFTLTESGSTPNRINTLPLQVGTAMPWFQIFGKVLGAEATDDLHVKIYKAKLTGNLEGTFQYGNFYVLSANGVAVKDTTNSRFVDVIAHETAVALPDS